MQAKYAIELLGITKRFGPIIANNKITLHVEQGTVHALIGENGAGKSVLMSILFGLYTPDSGLIKVNDVITEVKSPEHANLLGIGMVHQHFKLVENFTVLENITLGNETVNGAGIIRKSADRRRVMGILRKYRLSIDLDRQVKDLTVAEQQRVEIIKMLYRESDILILDEPTAVLSPNEITDFLEYILALKKLGKTIILISHKMHELKQVADNATVIRLGKIIENFKMDEYTIDEISELMVGKHIEERKVSYHSGELRLEPVLEVQDLTVEKINKRGIPGIENAFLNVKEGEIVAVAGVEGSGQSELIGAIMGNAKILNGNIKLLKSLKSTEATAVEMLKLSIKKRYDEGIAYIPDDRHKHGLILDDTVAINSMFRQYRKRPFSKLSIMNFPAIANHSRKIIETYDVRNAADGKALTRNLSGGNQQKIILGRELEAPSTLIVISQPTRGLDVGSISNVHDHILRKRNEKSAILLVSYELDEIVALADRVYVMSGGRITGELIGAEINASAIGRLMVGGTNA